MTSLSDLIDRVRTQARDDGGGFITDDDITGWINEAYVDLAGRLRIFEEEASGLTTDNIIPLPPEVVGHELIDLEHLILGTDDDVTIVDDDVWRAWSESGATPLKTIGRVFNRTVELYPTPAVDTAYSIRYIWTPLPLLDGTDVHLLPLRLERKLLEYAKAQAKFKDSDYSGGNNWLALYEQGLPRVSSGRELNVTGPLRITRSGNAWDHSRDARHIG